MHEQYYARDTNSDFTISEAKFIICVGGFSARKLSEVVLLADRENGELSFTYLLLNSEKPHVKETKIHLANELYVRFALNTCIFAICNFKSKKY